MKDLVIIKDGHAVTTSLIISQVFGRAHKDVLRSIDGLVEREKINRRDFAPIEYIDSRGRKQRAYELTKRAALIAMPFIGGEKAEKGQVRLVDAFLSMEALALSRQPVGTITSEQYQALTFLVHTIKCNTWFRESAQYALYVTLREMFGVRSIQDIPTDGFTQALQFLEQKKLEAEKHFNELRDRDLAFIKTVLRVRTLPLPQKELFNSQ
jgi:Rha family phage regulatory protein